MGVFQCAQLLKELVVLPVGKRRAIENVVVVVGALDCLSQGAGARRECGVDRQRADLRTLTFCLFADHLHGYGDQPLELLVGGLWQ